MSAVLALLSSVLWGAADFAGGMVARRLPPVAVVAGSHAVTMIFLGALVLGLGSWHGPLTWVPWAMAAGALGPASLVSFYAALASGTMGVVSPIAAVGAVIPVTFGLVTGDRPSPLAAMGIALALVGAVAASGPELSGQTTRRAVTLAALAGIGFGLTMIALAGGARSNPVMTLFGMRLVSVVALAGLGVARRSTGGIRGRDVPLLGAIGVADAAANLAYGLAARQGLFSVVSVLGALYPVVTVLLARVVLSERLTRVQQAGVAGALCGVAMLALG